MEFKDYAHSRGVLLNKDDLRFLDRQLKDFSLNIRASLLKEYLALWKKEMLDFKNKPGAENIARKNSNLYLLERCDDVKRRSKIL